MIQAPSLPLCHKAANTWYIWPLVTLGEKCIISPDWSNKAGLSQRTKQRGGNDEQKTESNKAGINQRTEQYEKNDTVRLIGDKIQLKSLTGYPKYKR